jgi:hypothetical protein
MFQTTCILLAMSKAIFWDRMVEFIFFSSQVRFKKLLRTPRMMEEEHLLRKPEWKICECCACTKTRWKRDEATRKRECRFRGSQAASSRFSCCLNFFTFFAEFFIVQKTPATTAYPAWSILNIRCVCMVQKPSNFWIVYFEWLQCQHYYRVIRLPSPPLQAALTPLYGSITFTQLEENFSMVKLAYLS